MISLPYNGYNFEFNLIGMAVNVPLAPLEISLTVKSNRFAALYDICVP